MTETRHALTLVACLRVVPDMEHGKGLRGRESVVYAESGRDRGIPIALSDSPHALGFRAILLEYICGRVPATVSIVGVGQAPEELGEEGLSPPVNKLRENDAVVVETHDACGVAHDDEDENERLMIAVEDGASVVDELPKGVTAANSKSVGIVRVIGLEITDGHDVAPSGLSVGLSETIVGGDAVCAAEFSFPGPSCQCG
jgi:hypothetical protein